MTAPTIGRLLVALDGTPQGRAAMETALTLATALRADVTGLFVEDEDLLRAAQVPIACHVDPKGRHDLRPADVARHVRGQSQHSRRALEAAAEKAGLTSTFLHRTGSVLEQISEAARTADLVVAGRGGWAAPGRLGSTARHLARDGGLPAVLLTQRPELSGRSVTVAVDGSPGTRKALDAAAYLANTTGRRLVVIACLADGSDPQLDEFLPVAGVSRVARTEPVLVSSTAYESGSALLVVPADADLLQGDEFLGRCDLPILIAR